MNTDEQKEPGFRDLLRKIQLLTEEDLAEYGPEITKRLRKTAQMFFVWTGVLVATMVFYIFASSIEYSAHQALLKATANAATVPSESHWFSVTWSFCVVIMALCTFMLTVSMTRVGLYSGVLGLLEGIGLSITNVVYKLLCVAVPGDFFDKKGEVQGMIDDAIKDRSVKKFAEKVSRGYANALAFIIGIPWLMLQVPLVTFAHPLVVLLSMIGIGVLVYQIYGWDSPPFWFDLIKQGLTYATATLVIINLLLRPVAESSGIFEGWGPANSGYVGKAFWFIIIVGALSLAFRRFHVKGKIVTNDDGKEVKKHSFHFNAKDAAIAVVFLIAAFMFGNLFLSTVLGATKSVSNPQGNGDGNTAANTAFHLPSLPDMTSITKKFYNPDAKAPEVDMGSGPFYKNPDQTLLPRVSYKFATSNTVYVYKDDGKLHRFQDGGALFSYYGCAGGQRVIDCTPVYEIPARVKPGDSILGGAVVNGSE